MISVKGLSKVTIHSLILFEDGSKGFVHHILEDEVIPKKEGFEMFEETLPSLPNDWELLYLDCDIHLIRNLGTWYRHAQANHPTKMRWAFEVQLIFWQQYY